MGGIRFPGMAVMRMALFMVIMPAMSAGSLAQTTAPASDIQLVERGREVAATQCSRCHVIDNENRMGGISSTASFPMMVNFLADWEERFASFATRNPHPAIVSLDGAPPASPSPTGNAPVSVRSADIAAIVEYARSLLEEGN